MSLILPQTFPRIIDHVIKVAYCTLRKKFRMLCPYFGFQISYLIIVIDYMWRKSREISSVPLPWSNITGSHKSFSWILQSRRMQLFISLQKKKCVPVNRTQPVIQSEEQNPTFPSQHCILYYCQNDLSVQVIIFQCNI